MILDLLKHRYEEAREIYADEWLGFSEAELEGMLQNAGFTDVQTSVVDKDARRAPVPDTARRRRQDNVGAASIYHRGSKLRVSLRG